MQSSIFDSFDVPVSKPAAKDVNSNPVASVKSSIFDDFDVPQPLHNRLTAISADVQSEEHTDTMQSKDAALENIHELQIS